ncbi:XRE family transcriptional regulator [Spongiactinospora rosea]|uniref:XRE family transcriptional regulator n=1 Tax=Spongiactinospora rosea TaxID=2248750 RepID=A0A366LTE1_9ACTN|nr:XRE family transcriptional regulator [Spongiactinospora rosea]
MAEDPQAWPHAELTGHPAAAVVQKIAATLAGILAERRLSLRGLAATSGVNRQSIADLLAGRSWPDVATIVLLEAALAVRLWPEGTPAPR